MNPNPLPNLEVPMSDTNHEHESGGWQWRSEPSPLHFPHWADDARAVRVYYRATLAEEPTMVLVMLRGEEELTEPAVANAIRERELAKPSAGRPGRVS